jgi:DNA-binding response OmpR family regulator
MRRSVLLVTDATERRRRVLVVEDDSDIASLLMEIFETDGYAPVVVSDSAALGGQLDPRPDLVVLDLRLTRDGAEHILATLHARGMSDVPVLLLSAANDLPARAQELGINSYLAKPFELEELLAVVRGLVT